MKCTTGTYLATECNACVALVTNARFKPDEAKRKRSQDTHLVNQLVSLDLASGEQLPGEVVVMVVAPIGDRDQVNPERATSCNVRSRKNINKNKWSQCIWSEGGNGTKKNQDIMPLETDNRSNHRKKSM